MMQQFILSSLILISLFQQRAFADIVQDEFFPKKGKIISTKQLATMQSYLKQSDFMSFDFTQVLTSGLRGKTRTMTGEAFLAKPAKFRWVKKTPVAEEIIYGGSDVFIYKPDQKQFLKFRSVGSQAQEFAKLTSLVLSFDKLKQSYDIERAMQDPATGSVYLGLEPRDKSEIVGVRVRFNPSQGFVSLVKIAYKDGRSVSYELSNPKFDKIPSERFSFTPAKDDRGEVFD